VAQERLALSVSLPGKALWRTRRTDGSLWWRYSRRALPGAAGVLVAAMVVLPTGLGYVTTHTGAQSCRRTTWAFPTRTSRSRPATGSSSRAGTPLLLIAAPIHGVGEKLNRRFAKAAGESATLWEIPESKHVGGLAARPEEYERRVVGFFNEALL
jgi:hypothetical protein